MVGSVANLECRQKLRKADGERALSEGAALCRVCERTAALRLSAAIFVWLLRVFLCAQHLCELAQERGTNI